MAGIIQNAVELYFHCHPFKEIMGLFYFLEKKLVLKN